MNEFTKKILIPPEKSGLRIDQLCAEYFPEISRTGWRKRGVFTCDGQEKTYKTKVETGEKWMVFCSPEKTITNEILPWNYPLTILKETENWVVIDKPYNISVHPSITEKSQQTMVNALVAHFGHQLSETYDEIDGTCIPRPGIVHRLDKTTSGVLLVAKNNQSHRFFQEHWKQVKKIYYAVVQGKAPPKGKISGGIIRHPHYRKKMMVSSEEKAKASTTYFECQAENQGQSLLKIQLETGRTHQIRVHLSSIGFPIIGDDLYGGTVASRVMLHATELHFPDPESPSSIISVTSTLPSEFLVSFPDLKNVS